MNRLSAHIRPLATFCVIGVVNTAAYYCVYLLLLKVAPYLVAHVAGWCVGIVVSYLLNCRFTYRVTPSWGTFVLFPLSNLPNIALSTVGVVVMVEWLGWPEKVAPLVATLLAIPASYLLARFILLPKPTDPLADPDAPGAR